MARKKAAKQKTAQQKTAKKKTAKQKTVKQTVRDDIFMEILTPPPASLLTMVRKVAGLASDTSTRTITGVICAKGRALAASGELGLERVKAKIHRAAQAPVATPNEPAGQEGEVGTWSAGGIHYNFRFIDANMIPDAKGGHSDASPAKNNHLVVWAKFMGDANWYPSESHNFWGRKADQTACEAPDVE